MDQYSFLWGDSRAKSTLAQESNRRYHHNTGGGGATQHVLEALDEQEVTEVADLEGGLQAVLRQAPGLSAHRGITHQDVKGPYHQALPLLPLPSVLPAVPEERRQLTLHPEQRSAFCSPAATAAATAAPPSAFSLI
ncbi:hypothetical protein EYF80_018902 [Liparis tanakae]|uniref:Rhodanese domain-containing protein n=1 Tax=Liparis tanakae TaxID=230148 RepID=A0A4Z2HYV3_9TELE|nr:hypothetical protein EYF80_018902 [Liparis tanakae]